MPIFERERRGKQEAVRGLQGSVERTTVKGGIYYPSSSSVIEALVLFASGEFRPDLTGKSIFFPGVLPGKRALGEPGSNLGFLINSALYDLRLDKPFTTEYRSTRANFPQLSTISINGVPEKGRGGYVIEITNSDPNVSDSPARLKTVEEGIVVAAGKTQRTLAERLTLPVVVEDGKFGVDVRRVIGTVRQAIEDVQMSSYFANPNDDFDNKWYNLVRAPYLTRRLVRAGRVGANTGELLQLKTSSNLVVDLGWQGIDLASLESRFGKLFGSVDTQSETPAFTVSIHDRRGLPIDNFQVDGLASKIKDAFERSKI